MGYKINVPINEKQLAENRQDIWIDSKLDSDANAVSASKLFTGRYFKVSLSSDSAQIFNGESDATVIGVGGILPTQHGGTGQDDLDKVIVGGAKSLNSAHSLKVSLPSDNAPTFNGTADVTVIGTAGILPTQKGGTGQDDLNKVTVGKANTLTNARSFKVSLESDHVPSFNGTSAVTIGTFGILPTQKGGTGQNNLDNVIVGGAKSLNSAHSLKVSLPSDNAQSFNGTADVTVIGTAGILPTQKGGTGQNNLNNITVGGASRDGSGNNIVNTYMPKSGGTFTGAINTANGTWNTIGDDVAIGDHDVGGGLGIIGLNGNTRLDFCKKGTPSNYKSITYDGTSLNLDGNANYASSAGTAGNVTGIVAIPNGGTGATTAAGARQNFFGDDMNNSSLAKYIISINDNWQKGGFTTIQNLRNFMGLGDTTSYLPVANGGTGTNNLNNITVGGANRDGNGNVITSTYVAKESGKGLSSNDFTTSEKNKLAAIAENANNYVLPTATNAVLGGVKIGSNISNNNGTISLSADNVTSALGYTPPTTNTTYNNATSTTNGLMSSIDKSKLDNISNNAQVNVIESVKVNNTALPITNKAVNIDLTGYLTSQNAANTYLSTAAAASIYATKDEAVGGDGISPSELATVTVGGAVRDGDGHTITSTYLTTLSASQTYLPLSGGTLTGKLIGTTIKADSFKGLGTHYFGTCATASNNSVKAVTCTDFALATGAILTVKFDNYNSAESIALNVNKTGAIDVLASFESDDPAILCEHTSNSFKSPAIGTNNFVTFIFNGTNWALFGDNLNTELLNGLIRNGQSIALSYAQMGHAPHDTVYYGYSTTADNTAAKIVYCPEWNSDVMTTDAFIIVKFDNTNSASSNPTLNIHDTGDFRLAGAHGRAVSSSTLFSNNTTYVIKWKANIQRYFIVQAFDFNPRMSWYIESSTDGNDAAKINSESRLEERAFCRRHGMHVTLNLKNDNIASNPTLNINRTGANNLYIGSTKLSGSVMKAGIYDLIYDAINKRWQVISMPNYTALGTDSIKAEGAMWLSWS